MAATREDIQGWLQQAKEEGHDYLIVVCDTFDWDDYPVGVSRADFWERHDLYVAAPMQRVMEVYDLNGNIPGQMTEHRANHPPPRED